MGFYVQPRAPSEIATLALQRAQFDIGYITDAVRIFTDADDQGLWAPTAGGTGTLTQVTTQNAGLWTLATGATASSGYTLLLTGQPRFIPNVTGKRWHISARMAITTAIDAQARCTVGCATDACRMGVYGAFNTTTFHATVVGGTGTRQLQSARAIDTAMHTFRCWDDGVTVYFSVDNETPVSAASGGAGAANSNPEISSLNQTTAANRSMTVDWVQWYGQPEVSR